MNSTLYPFGARLRDGCTVYECQNRDNCGKFVPVEWGMFFTTTKYGNIRYTLYRNPMFFFYLRFAYNTVFKRTYFGLTVYCNCFNFITRLLLGGQMLWTGRQMEVRSRLFYFYLHNVPEIKWGRRHGSSKRHRQDDDLEENEHIS